MAKTLIIFSLPAGAYFILKAKREQLSDPAVHASYSTLYQNIRIHSRVHGDWPLLNTPLFLIKRLVIAFLTVALQDHPLSQISAYIVFSLVSLAYILSVRPMETTALNTIELINEGFVLLAGYCLLLFTDIVPSVETRYLIG